MAHLKIVPASPPPTKTTGADGRPDESAVNGEFDQVLQGSQGSGDKVVGQDPSASLHGVTGPRPFSVPLVFKDSPKDPVAEEKVVAVMKSFMEMLFRRNI